MGPKRLSIGELGRGSSLLPRGNGSGVWTCSLLVSSLVRDSLFQLAGPSLSGMWIVPLALVVESVGSLLRYL